MQARLESLRNRHAELSKTVAAAEAVLSVDHVQVAALKREKLRLKDEIARLSAA